ncbi:MAG: glycosyltransferase family 4 protein [Methanomicrobiaceae archaeon]|uniref:Glycosyl transferase n=1 Tax=hydrocarbon metagenome TaxID=938273 RepID=A0A0W8FLG2_9ZZZZ|nr:glycosyltransferase family 4 protein [Methanomicrobiaceae archaeon]MDD5419162.1 glycosyltransferase family 4 protein [Methanomicrobiaceae archaeon]
MAERRGIVLITGRWAKDQHPYATAVKLIAILRPLFDDVTWILTEQADRQYPDADGVAITRIRDRYLESPFAVKLLYYLRYQLRLISCILRIDRDQDTLIFAFGAEFQFPAILAGKLLGKRIVLRTDGRPSGVIRRYEKGISIFYIRALEAVEALVYRAADRIVPESPSMVHLYGLEKYRRKIEPGGLYVDTRTLVPKKSLRDRPYRVGYMGRLSTEKGITELVEAVPLICNGDGGRAIIIGTGPLRGDVERRLSGCGMQEQVVVAGWIEDGDVPEYLNNIQIMVVPSYREGLPIIALESMACGCILLATPVGGIPDLIRDGRTGFLLPDNSPASIAAAVQRIVNRPDLSAIGRSARELIERHYTYDAAVERYRKVFYQQVPE